MIITLKGTILFLYNLLTASQADSSTHPCPITTATSDKNLQNVIKVSNKRIMMLCYAQGHTCHIFLLISNLPWFPLPYTNQSFMSKPQSFEVVLAALSYLCKGSEPSFWFLTVEPEAWFCSLKFVDTLAYFLHARDWLSCWWPVSTTCHTRLLPLY